MKKSVLAILLAGAAMHAESSPSNQVVMASPSPNQILVVQERNARERYYADRATMAALAQEPAAAAAEPQAPRGLSERERGELRQALDRFFERHPGVIIDAGTGKPLETPRHAPPLVTGPASIQIEPSRRE